MFGLLSYYTPKNFFIKFSNKLKVKHFFYDIKTHFLIDTEFLGNDKRFGLKIICIPCTGMHALKPKLLGNRCTTWVLIHCIPVQGITVFKSFIGDPKIVLE